MNCRNCNNEVQESAVACLKCGQDPKSGTKFCYDCGGETNEKQVICLKCGISLEGSSSTKTTTKSLSNVADGFYCSSDDKMILGVCGGLAHKFGIQTSIVRIAVLISGFFFIGWFYFVGFFLPKRPTKNI